MSIFLAFYFWIAGFIYRSSVDDDFDNGRRIFTFFGSLLWPIATIMVLVVFCSEMNDHD